MLQQLRLMLGFGAVSFALFAAEVALMIWLLSVFESVSSASLGGIVRLGVVLKALVFTALTTLGVLGLQSVAHAARRIRERGADARLEAWTEVWMALLWQSSRASARLNGVSARSDRSAAEALLRLCDTLRDEDAGRAANLYRLHGLMSQDLQALWRSREELRVLALENLARARHPASIHALERCFVNASPEVKRLTLLTLARVCARAKLGDEELVRRFVPKLTQFAGAPWLSSGTVERTLALLEHSSLPVIAALLRPDAKVHLRAALKSVGLLRAVTLSQRCTPWLKDPDLNLRCAAARALYQIGAVPVDAVDDLYAMLEERAWETRAQAVLAFTWVDEARVEGTLLRALGDENWWVRHNTAIALSKRGLRGLTALRNAAQHHEDAFARDMANQRLLELVALEGDGILEYHQDGVWSAEPRKAPPTCQTDL